MVVEKKNKKNRDFQKILVRISTEKRDKQRLNDAVRGENMEVKELI